MRIAYLMNTYPVTSSTFIRREIAALEALGLQVSRFSIRRWSEDFVDQRDRDEQARTRYLLSGHEVSLLLMFFTELFLNPFGLIRAFGTWFGLLFRARRGLVRHAAYLLEAISLRRQTTKNGIAHVHAHFSTNTAAVALLCSRLGGPGYSFTAHGPDEFVDWGPTSLDKKVAGARFVAAISHFCRVQLVRAAGMAEWEKIHIVRCGLDLSEFAGEPDEIDRSMPFVTVGRLCPQKAQTLIVEAVAMVAQDRPEVKVRLIGDGESRPDVEAAIEKHGLQKNIELLGWQDNRDVQKNLRSARALLLPSFAEGLPVVIMEAFALGRPAITTYIAGIPELVDSSCGWVIPAGSIEHIASAMTEALDAAPDALQAMGREGRRRIEREHDIKQSAEKLAHLFREYSVK